MLIENCAQGDKAEVCSTFLYMHVQLYTDTTPLPPLLLPCVTKRGMGEHFT